MPLLVVPFRGAQGKSRLAPLSERARGVLAREMLADVIDACMAVGTTLVVGPAGLDLAGVSVIPDRGGGQGAAVRAGLQAVALQGAGVGPFLVVNADLPCVTPRDLLALAGAVPEGGLALAAASDGTTNAIALSSPDLFVPRYGRGSAARFAALGDSRSVEAPNLIDDVDTLADLERVHDRLGPHTRAAVLALRLGAAA